jgi:hypothetical protein
MNHEIFLRPGRSGALVGVVAVVCCAAAPAIGGLLGGVVRAC